MLGLGATPALAVADPIVPPDAPPPAAPYHPPEDWHDLLRLDDSIREFFAAHISRDRSAEGRLQAIVDAIVSPTGLHYCYEAEGSYDVRETFRRRRGNCQSFAFLVVAVAREYHLEAKFQDIETFACWGRYGRFVAAVRHTNVLVRTGDASYVVDPRPDLGRPTLSSSRFVVSDQRACSHLYSTAGFFCLVAGESDAAQRLTELATRVDPTAPIAWSNLGYLRAQRNELPAARQCFERALKLNAREDAALTGLVDVLRRLGGPAELRDLAVYEQRARKYRDRNPYYAYFLGGQAREAGDLPAAEKHFRRAIRLKDDEPLFHDELGQLLRRQGREREALRVETKATRIREKLAAATIPLIP